MVSQLPLDGALGRSVGSLQSQTWQNAEELLALIAELIYDNTSVTMMVNAKKGTPPPKPFRIPRPETSNHKPKKKRAATADELRAIFGAPNSPPLRRPKQEAE